MKCDKCNGTGYVVDYRKQGADLRFTRKRARISLQAVADKMGLSPGYISDLEHGRRNWTRELIVAYEVVLRRLVK